MNSNFLTDKEYCTGCAACQNSCPKSAIKMEEDKEGFLYPIINFELCVNCHICEKVCPISIDLRQKNTDEYISLMGKSNNKDIRINSSSGGIFSHLALKVLNDKGIVSGAVFSEDFKNVKHIIIHSEEDLKKLCGSKYIQSEVGDVYVEIKKELEEGKTVLFSGTGCQVSGLKAFLGKEYRNLICVEVVCHGVPSHLVWVKYLDYLQNKYKSSPVQINFRCKKKSRKSLGIKGICSKKVYYRRLRDDPYLQLFQKNIDLRPSCYNCKFKIEYSQSDLTIGDLWGAEAIAPEFNDNQGISFVLSKTEKGQKLIDELKDDITFLPVDLKKVIDNNPSIVFPPRASSIRTIFFDEISKDKIQYLMRKYTNKSFYQKFKCFLEDIGMLRILRKFKIRKKGTNNSNKIIDDKNLEYGLLIVFK